MASQLTCLGLPEDAAAAFRLTNEHKATLLDDARSCFFLMMAPAPFGIQAVTTQPCFEYIAAALAIMRGYFRIRGGKRDGQPNFAAAAAGVGRSTDHPAQLRKWLGKLQKLEAKLSLMKAGGEQCNDAMAKWQFYADERRRVWDNPGTRFLRAHDSEELRPPGRPVNPDSKRQLLLAQRAARLAKKEAALKQLR
jgi:hypothetical protein